MFDKLQEFLEDDEELFCIGGVSSDNIDNIERELNVVLPADYRIFLEKYGLIIGYGVEILGGGKEGEAPVVTHTKRYRNLGLPNNYIVIENADEWVYCLDLANGIVVSWDRSNPETKQVADSFEEYLNSTISEAKEVWDE